MSSAGPATDTSRALGRQVRVLRQRRGLTQQQLATRMGSTQPAVAALEAGDVHAGRRMLERLAIALDAHAVFSLVAREDALTRGVPVQVLPNRERCGFVSTTGGRSWSCNRAVGHGGQHRELWFDEDDLFTAVTALFAQGRSGLSVRDVLEFMKGAPHVAPDHIDGDFASATLGIEAMGRRGRLQVEGAGAALTVNGIGDATA